MKLAIADSVARVNTVRFVGCVLLVCALTTGRASAQDDVISRARAASAEGRRAEALMLLEDHLADSPQDVDARLTYGLMLSWDGKFAQARTQLQRVLATSPDYGDAKVALMNVEYLVRPDGGRTRPVDADPGARSRQPAGKADTAAAGLAVAPVDGDDLVLGRRVQ